MLPGTRKWSWSYRICRNSWFGFFRALVWVSSLELFSIYVRFAWGRILEALADISGSETWKASTRDLYKISPAHSNQPGWNGSGDIAPSPGGGRFPHGYSSPPGGALPGESRGHLAPYLSSPLSLAPYLSSPLCLAPPVTLRGTQEVDLRSVETRTRDARSF